MNIRWSQRRALVTASCLALASAGAGTALASPSQAAPAEHQAKPAAHATRPVHATRAAPGHRYGRDHRAQSPIKHVVVIFQENVSFDHYFATYPHAANNAGETQQGTNQPATPFHAAPNTPRNIDTLAHAGLLAPNNPNSAQPFRLSPSQAVTCDQDHDYTAEQKAFDGGLMDRFVEYTSRDACAPNQYGRPGLTMGYYDGNTVTGLWNYAQHYAMSDNSYSSTFGPSTPGALNLVSGQTHGVRSYDPVTRQQTSTPDSYTVKQPNADGVGTVTGDPDPVWDDCSSTKNKVAGMDGLNVGDLLNEKGVSWGWFQGGFTPDTTAADSSNGRAACTTSHTNVAGVSSTDYNPHHEPFQYYRSTANPHHLPPASLAEVGHDGQANHQYDMSYFNQVVESANMPAVSFLKAPNYQDGHASYSDPIDEQHFVVDEINRIQKSPNWKNTMVVLAYDDSDGWYDHRMAKLTNSSHSSDDAAVCQDSQAPVHGGYADRCGPGTRQPLLVVSPYAKRNYVDHTQTDQASILRFIEDNWGTGRIGDASFDGWAGSLTGMLHLPNPQADRVLLDPSSGAVVSRSR